MKTDRFANNLRSIRIARGMTQTQVAKLLFVTPQTVSKWENGASLPDVENLCELATLLRSTPDRLLGIGAEQERLFVGIDSGGTKTDAVLFREDGTVLRRKKFPGANPNTCGPERAAEILSNAVEELCGEYSITGIFAGVAGCTAADNRTKLTGALKKKLPGIPFALGSDIENVIHSVRGIDRCVAVISGTGSVIFAWDSQELHRFGGYGYLLDGAGSGYDIGRDALKACLEADDGLRPKSLMTELATKQLGASAWSKLSILYHSGPEGIASFAPVVFQAARQGDGEAMAILRNNVSRIATLIRHARSAFDCGETVLCAGSIAATEEFRSILRESGLSPTVPEQPPVYGACVKCATIYNIGSPEKFDRNFTKTLPN